MRLILPALLVLSTSACATLPRVETVVVVPEVPEPLREVIAPAPITETDPALMAAQGVTNLLIIMDRLVKDRAAVDAILDAAEKDAGPR